MAGTATSIRGEREQKAEKAHEPKDNAGVCCGRGKVAQRGYVAFEGPRAQEEQYRHDLMEDELAWRPSGGQPHTAELLAQVAGAESFEMEVGEDEEEGEKEGNIAKGQ